MKLNFTASATFLFLAISPISALAIASEAPEAAEVIDITTKEKLPSCQSEYHPCSIYHEFEECSPKWLKWIGKCGASGCIQWFRDPTEDCRTTPIKPVEA
ncbi:hypothetical protein BJ508DRAFT_411845 [Ascobolus immersus RN42]|uniref:Kazal-like domain-containing protein n=1 Tax=Ascobolus immersus RN42 TaxID=1160509 RepID=A0A3N4IJR0_ASCIM|nr:hypothetical protein BJ508DRAFT_411845 [Ascobolus immersus RN42]